MATADLNGALEGFSVLHGTIWLHDLVPLVNQIYGHHLVADDGIFKRMKALGEIVRIRREEKGLSQPQLAKLLGIRQQTLSNLENGLLKKPPSYILRLIDVLEIDPRELPEIKNLALQQARDQSSTNVVPLTKIQPNVGNFVAEPPSPRRMPKDVPVYGTAVGGASGAFHLNGEVIDYLRRPPGVADVVGLFAVYVQGDSMWPRYEAGDPVYCHPKRPAKNGDDVVVELHGRDGEPGDCFVKRLKNRTPTKLILGQFNPADVEIEIDLGKVRNIYRIIPNSELLGL